MSPPNAEVGPTAARFRWLALATCAATYALIVLGGVVRVTGAGDACPDWPRCHGELLPPLERDVLIEFSHRLVASLVGLLVVATALVAWRGQRRPPVARWGSLLAVGLVVAQIILGGVTVLNDLSSNLVTAHLALASALLATLVVVTLAALASPDTSSRRSAQTVGLRNLVAFSALAVFALMLTGSYMTGSGASVAFTDWPLFDGQLWPEGGRPAMIHATHRLAAALVGVLLAYVTVRAWRTEHAGPVALGTALALGLYVAQVFVGAANLWTELQPAARTAHLALAVAVWAVLVGITALSQRALQGAPDAVREGTAAAPSLASAPAGRFEAGPAGGS